MGWCGIMVSRVLLSRPSRLPATGMPGIIGGMAWLTFEQVARLVVGLVVGAWTARYLGPASYGELANVLAFLALFQAVSTLGMHATVVRDAVRDASEAPVLLGTALAARVAAGGACFLLAVGTMAAWHGPQSEAVLLTVLAGGTLVLQGSDVVDLWFQSQGQNQRAVLARLVALLLAAAVRVALILGGAPLSAFAAVVSLEMGAAAAALAFAYRRLPSAGRWQASASQLGRMLRECWPFLVSAAAAVAYGRADQVIVREHAGAEQAGLYAAVMPLSLTWAVLPTALQVSLAPSIARLKLGDPAAYRDGIVRVFRLFFVLGLAASASTALLSAPLVRWLYGSAYAGSASLLAVHVFTNVFVCLGIGHTLWVVNESRLMLRLWGNLAAGTFAVLANLWLVPAHGAMAAAWVAVAGQFIAAVGINFVLARDSFWLQVRAVTGLRIGEAAT